MERIEIKSQPTGPDAPVEVIPDVETATAESTSSESRTDERPSWLPEKFNSPEDLAKAYGELEKQFTQKTQTGASKDEATKTDGTKADAPKTDETVNELVENAG